MATNKARITFYAHDDIAESISALAPGARSEYINGRLRQASPPIRELKDLCAWLERKYPCTELHHLLFDYLKAANTL